jgi:DNA invertase Pin-like site-specific DNA recombinase
MLLALFCAFLLGVTAGAWLTEAAKARGVYKGRPVTFDHAKIVALRKEGLGAMEIARAVGCKRGNVYKALKAAGVA